MADDQIFNQIEKLSELKKKGLLTEDEFQIKKESLLEKITSTPTADSHFKTDIKQSNASYWLSIPSMILGIISCCAFFDPSPWESDEIKGIALFSIAGLILGIIGLSTNAKGKGMAIAGIVLASIAILMLIGSSQP